MPNLRIVADNAADRAALTASTTSGALAVTNLQTDDKSAVYRATGTTASVRGVLPAPEIASCAHLTHCNLSPTATMRVRLTNEAAATNLLLQSEDLSNAAYSKGNVTIPLSDIAPDGASTARLVKETTANNVHYVEQLCATLAATTYTLSFFIGANNPARTRGRINVGTLGAYADFNISGAGSIAASGGAGCVNSTIAVVGAIGFYRVTLTFLTVGAATHNMVLYLANSAGTLSYLGDGTTGLYAWGWQLELGSVATSYIPTTTTTASRAVGFIDSWQPYALDTGAVLACPAQARVPRGFTAAQAASAYANGGGAHARAWFAPTSYIGFCIDIVDTANLQGYIEAARLVIGTYWAPQYNASAAPLRPVDSTEMSRNGAGGLMRKTGTIHREVEIDLRLLAAADRSILADMLMNSRAYPILLSVFPGHSDLSLERDYTVYGCIGEDSEISIQYAGAYASKVKVVEI